MTLHLKKDKNGKQEKKTIKLSKKKEKNRETKKRSQTGTVENVRGTSNRGVFTGRSFLQPVTDKTCICELQGIAGVDNRKSRTIYRAAGECAYVCVRNF